MNGALRESMSLDQFLAWKERQELRWVHHLVAVCEVVSPSTPRTDRIEKLRVSSNTVDPALCYPRAGQHPRHGISRLGADWIARALTEDDLLRMPEIGIELALADICANLPQSTSEDNRSSPSQEEGRRWP